MRRSKKPPWARLETAAAFLDTEPLRQSSSRSATPRVSSASYLTDPYERSGGMGRSSATSLLIVCLVEQLCSFIEKDPVRNHKLNDSLLKQLHRLQMVDEISPTLQFETMKQKLKQDLCTMVSHAKCCVDDSTLTSSLQPLVPRFVDQLDSACSISRYSTEFEMLSYISRGGFGQVFSVKNHLDGCKYAIKKIYVRSQTALYRSIINEVTTLARIQHPNIVKYYGAWLEPLSSACASVSNIRIVEESSELGHYSQTNSRNLRQFEESSGSSYIQFHSEDQEWSRKVDGHTVEHREESFGVYREDTSSELSTSSLEQDSLSACGGAVIPVQRQGPGMSTGSAVLYIQMELCGRSLRQWLDFSPVEAEPSSMLGFLQLQTRLSFFWQLSSALEYLHQQNIVHHDIKPSNIFVFGNNRVKLGDFGLACSYENSKARVHHAWGTNTYAAPEQLHGGLCNFKSDVYSTGLILLELLMPPFKTNAERIHLLSQLRNHSHVPDTIRTQLPHWGTLLCRLTQTDANLRPTSSEVRIKVQDLLCLHFSDLNDQSRHKTASSVTKSSPHKRAGRRHVVNGAHTLETRDDLLVRESARGEESVEPLLRLARLQDLQIQVEVLRAELRQRDFQIRALREQVRLLSLQLQP